ncbi:MAG: DUF5686 and carboxypeptidase regulatory-like domain-containing protein [Chitinophagaceae bacterium]
MKFTLFFSLFIAGFIPSVAATISGVVKDDKGNLLSYASILVKNTRIGTTTNEDGRYVLQLDPGTYVLVCQYVGYTRQETEIIVKEGKQVVNFTLTLQQTSLKEVIVKPGGEDPAYEIIRNAIKKRPYYLNQLEEFQCEVYNKGQFKLRDYPKKLFGQKVDFEDADTSKLKMLYLAESVSTYSVQKPGKVKIEVSSTKVSGQSDGFGLSQPEIISFYQNILPIGINLNPRGFVSPVAYNALRYYKYRLEGVFVEDGKEINKILVIPQRKYEPCFAGYINIQEGDWRIHSIKLLLTKDSQMDILDSLQIEQLYVPVSPEVWVIKNQVIYPAAKMFGFDGYGSFVNVYSKFNIDPNFAKNFFDNTFLTYTDSSNKRSRAYWDSIRPVPLEAEEIKDYLKKDSLESIRKSPRYLDSLDRKRNKISMTGLLFTGLTFTKQRKLETYSLVSLLNSVTFNTAEGFVVNLEGSYTRRLDSSQFVPRFFSITPKIRYGFSNRHLNAGVLTNYSFGKTYASSVRFSGGKDVFQFNNQNPVWPLGNTITTLFFEQNFLKTYEAWYGKGQLNKGIGDGLSVTASMEFQSRLPLENTTTYSVRDVKERSYTPNFPVELQPENIKRHQAFILAAGFSWQPGARYITFPGRKVNIGSKYPTFHLNYTKGIEGFFSSDINYDKWRVEMVDDINFKLAGQFDYRVSIGGFINSRKVQMPDYQHFNGNQSVFAGTYLNSFQLAPYYRNSTITSFYTTLNAEHHFNGLITNKIPLLRKFNWHLVTGTNAFYVNPNSNYVEIFAGIKNIFRFFRIDFIQSFSAGHKPYSGITLGLQGALFPN